MAKLMPLPVTVSCFSKIQIGFTFLVLAKGRLTGVFVIIIYFFTQGNIDPRG